MSRLGLGHRRHATLTGKGRLTPATVTKWPCQAAGVHALICKAPEVARLKSIPLVNVEVPLGLYSGLEADYARLQLHDCGRPFVLRFVDDCSQAMD